MLLQSEIQVKEIYVEDKEIDFDKAKPQLFQMVEESRAINGDGLFGMLDRKTNPTWENVVTGELVDWGTHCFTTIERIKKQFFNIKSIQKKDRADYIREAFALIQEYETHNGG